MELSTTAARKLAAREIIDHYPHPPMRRRVTVNLAESPISWLHSRGHLDDRQLAAGELLRRDFETARMMPPVTMRWDPVRLGRDSADHLNPTERQLAARQRFDAAMAHAGRDLCDVLWRVACAGEALPATERGLNWPARSGKLVLRIALDRIADFYCVPKQTIARRKACP